MAQSPPTRWLGTLKNFGGPEEDELAKIVTLMRENIGGGNGTMFEPLLARSPGIKRRESRN
jgi:hypothetical protein